MMRLRRRRCEWLPCGGCRRYRADGRSTLAARRWIAFSLVRVRRCGIGRATYDAPARCPCISGGRGMEGGLMKSRMEQHLTGKVGVEDATKHYDAREPGSCTRLRASRLTCARAKLCVG